MTRIRRGFEPLEENDPWRLGRFELLAVLGSGGFGNVYLGRDDEGVLAAVKVMRDDLAAEPVARSRFELEVGLCLSISNPFTVGFLATDTSARRPWMATDFVDGPNLAEAITEIGPFDEEALLALAGRMAAGLDGLHSAGVIHRDLKPSNVMLTHDGLKIIDFGIAQTLEGSPRTEHVQTPGSPPFMSHEQARGLEVTQASDISSWAATICFAASGLSPYGEGSSLAISARVADRGYRPIIPELPVPLAGLVRRALEPEPQLRPTASEIVRELSTTRAVPVGRDPDETIEVGLPHWQLPPETLTELREVPERIDADTRTSTALPARLTAGLAVIAIVGLVVLLRSTGSEEETAGQNSSSAPSATTTPVGTQEGEGSASGSTPDDTETNDGALEDGEMGSGAGTPSCSAPSEHLKIGVLLPESGEHQQWTRGMTRAVSLVVEQINESGGVNGAPIELINVDEGSLDADLKVPLALDRLLCQEQVSAVIGGFHNLERQLVAERTSAWPVVFCTPFEKPERDRMDPPLLISTKATELAIARSLGAYLAEIEAGTVALFGDSDALEGRLASGFTPMFEAGGGTVADRGFFAGSEAVVVAFDDLENAEVFGRLESAGIDSSTHDIFVLNRIGSHLDARTYDVDDPTRYAGTTLMFDDLTGMDNMASASLKDQLRQQLDDYQPSDWFYVPHVVDCVVLLALAAQSAGSSSPLALAAHIHAVSVNGTQCMEFLTCASLLEEGEHVDYEGLSGWVDFHPDGSLDQGLLEVAELDETGEVGHVEWRWTSPALQYDTGLPLLLRQVMDRYYDEAVYFEDLDTTPIAEVEDATGSVRMDVPAKWSEVDGRAGLYGPMVVAAPDLASYRGSWRSAGAEVGLDYYSPEVTHTEVIERLLPTERDGCRTESLITYETDIIYLGEMGFSYCDERGTEPATVVVALSASPSEDPEKFKIYFRLQLADKADIAAFSTVISSFIATVEDSMGPELSFSGLSKWQVSPGDTVVLEWVTAASTGLAANPQCVDYAMQTVRFLVSGSEAAEEGPGSGVMLDSCSGDLDLAWGDSTWGGYVAEVLIPTETAIGTYDLVLSAQGQDGEWGRQVTPQVLEVVWPDEADGEATDPTESEYPETEAVEALSVTPDSGSGMWLTPSDCGSLPGSEEREVNLLKIGALLPLANEDDEDDETSGAAHWGTGPRIAIELAVENVNKNGGVNGAPVELVVAPEGDFSDVATLYDSLRVLFCDEGVAAVIGPFANSKIEPLVELAVTWPAVVCSPLTEAGWFGERNGYFFSTIGTRFQLAESLAGHVFAQGHRTVAVVSAEASVGQYLLDGFVPLFTELGGEVSYSGPVTQSSLRQVISAGVDAIVIDGSSMNSGVVLSRLEAAGLTSDTAGLYIAIDVIGDLNDKKGFTGAPENFQGTQLITIDEFGELDLPTGALVFSRDEEASMFNLTHSMDCVWLIALAAVEAGSNDPAVFASNMISVSRDGRECNGFVNCSELLGDATNIDFSGMSGSIDFDLEGNLGAGSFEVTEADGDGVFRELFDLPIG